MYKISTLTGYHSMNTKVIFKSFIKQHKKHPIFLVVYCIAAFLFMFNSLLQANQQVFQEVVSGVNIPKFVEPLPTFYGKRVDGTRRLRITAEEFQQQILPASFYEALPSSVTYRSTFSGSPVAVINPRKGTFLWGYKVNDGKRTFGPSVPAPTIVAQKNVKTKVHYVNHLYPFTDKEGNKLPGPLLQKFLTVDQSLCWANPLNTSPTIPGFDPTTGLPLGNPAFYSGPQPMTVHLHGAEVPSYSDGHPEAWFTPGKCLTGPGFVTDHYTYPNTEQSTTLWYHDHVLGETRLNVYAGQAGFYFIRGNPESQVCPRLPRGKYEVELAVQDRQFDTNGQIYFPDGQPPNAGVQGNPGNPTIHPYWIEGFLGDVICVNGKSWPYLEVEPRRYRFRLLNASNLRIYALRLQNQAGMTSPPAVPVIWQIGADGGLFDKPVAIDSFVPFTFHFPMGAVFNSPRLIFGPAERLDIIIDFSGFEGQTFTFINDQPFHGSMGEVFPNPNADGLVLQFRVTKHLSSKDKSFNPAIPGATLRHGDNKVVQLADGKGGLAPGVFPDKTRSLVLIEQEDPNTHETLTLLLNNTHYNGLSQVNNQPIPDSIAYNDGTIYATEIPQVGSTEIWELVNLTGEAHLIHIHLIDFQLMNTQLFNVGNVIPPFIISPSYRNTYETAWGPGGTLYGAGPPFLYLSTPKLGGNPDVTPYLIGQPIPPDPNLKYWKDTIITYPEVVTRLVVRFAPQALPVSKVVAGQNKYPFDPTAPLGVKNDGFGYPGGPGYVWHCHILDHEDNDMMRPMQIGNSPQ